MWRDSDLLCIGQLQLLWMDKNSEQMLASLRLYFLPENTPEGRMDHGEDEVLAISEKVVIRIEDLITWITVEAEWTWGRLACHEGQMEDVEEEPETFCSPKKLLGHCFSLAESMLDFCDVEQERQLIEQSPEEMISPHVIILSYQKYCRYRAMMKRLEGVENLYLKYKIVNALGGFYVKYPNTRVLFCRDTFDYPELEGHELLCNHLTPKLKGRPRGKRKKRSVSPGSESNDSESSLTNHYTKSLEKSGSIRSDSPIVTRRSTRNHDNYENKEFLKTLTAFMKSKQLPVGRVPSLGCKELNLYEFFTKVQKLGGYDAVTANRLWKTIFDDMSGYLNNSSAASVVRRHYERFLLAYERHLKGEEYKPLPLSERRRLKTKRRNSSNSSISDTESSSEIPTPPALEEKSPASSEYKGSVTSGKTVSLRSVRVKPERQKEKQNVKDELKLANSDSIESKVTATTNNEFKQECNDSLLVKEDVTIKMEAAINSIDNKLLNRSISEESKQEAQEDEKNEREVEEVKKECNEILPDKDSESITLSDVVPSPPKTPLDKVLSPGEGKENIPITKENSTSSSPETPILSNKSNEPDVGIVESEFYKNLNNSFIHDVKKMKLDILKEGGLEVTPVKPGKTPSFVKEIRPSVIHTTTVKSLMPPPLTNSILPKKTYRSMSPNMQINRVESPSTPVKQIKSSSFPFLNGSTPPKVVQSKSIYSYSENIIYGNPKDNLAQQSSPVVEVKLPQTQNAVGDAIDLSTASPQKHAVEIIQLQQTSASNFLQPVLTPRFMYSATKQSGGHPMDLSVTSPDKPAVEITKMPQSCSPSNRERITKNLYKSAALLEGRKLGSNLEITLVKAPDNSLKLPSHPTRTAQNRSSYSSRTASVYKIEEPNKPIKYKSSAEINIPIPASKNIQGNKNDPKASQIQKNMMPSFSQSAPACMPHLPDNVNGMSSFSPLMDSLYYQAAIQNVYSNISNLRPPILPIPTPEQLKFYAELMAHGRYNLPFQLYKDEHSSVSNNNKNS